VADVNVSRLTMDGAGSVTRMQGEGRNESSRLGIRGMEDIGGGWGAGFWFEAGVFYESGGGQNTTSNNTAYGQTGISTSTSNGTASPDIVSLGATQGLTFNRASVVSLLNKGVGEIRLGRDYVPTFWNLTVFDPFGTVGSGAHTNLSFGTLHARPAVAPPGNPSPMVRTSNSVGWLSNDIGGFRFQLQTGLSEQISTCTDTQTSTGNNVDAGGNLCQAPAGDGKYSGGRVQYMSGPLHVAAAYGKTTYTDIPGVAGTAPVTKGAVTAYLGDYKAMNLAAAYTMGSTKLMAQYGTQEFGSFSQGFAAGTNTALTTGNGAWTNGAAAGAYTQGITSTTARKLTHTLLGVTHTTGAWTLKGSYGTAKLDGAQASNTAAAPAGAGVVKAIANPEDGARQTQVAVGAVYDLSKRTAVYGTYSTLKTTGQNTRSSMGIATAANLNLGDSVTATGLDLGVRHRF